MSSETLAPHPFIYGRPVRPGEFLDREAGSEVLFVGTGRPVEAEVLGRRGLDSRKITAAGFKGKGLLGRLRSLASLPVGLVQSMAIIAGFRPDVVFGVGGYSSGPVGVAARMMGCLTAIHEQNSIPGLTNRLLGRLVHLVFISFESSRRFFPADKTRLTGNPIRREIAAAARAREEREADGFTLLIVGGSQGAHAVNVAAVGAVGLLAEELPSLSVIHQTGPADYDLVLSAYEKMDIRTEVQAFIQDMARAYLAADLVVGRAGALTVAEIAAMGLPALFIPLPTAANNHQEINARSMTEAGAAEIILQADLTPEVLAERVGRLAGDRDRLEDMARAAASEARPEAAAAICDLCLDLLESGQGFGRGGR